MEKTIVVEGMHCQGCENRLKNSLNTIPGVETLSADHTTGNVVVNLENADLLAQVLEKLETIGFTVLKKDN